MNIFLISCVGEKKSRRCKAKDLYDSTWFRYAWQYAQFLKPGKVFILSAKHGLIDPETEIDPYEETLNTKSDKEIQAWAKAVLDALKKNTSLTNDVFAILAGERYRRYLISSLKNNHVPMMGMKIGQQLKWLKERCNDLR